MADPNPNPAPPDPNPEITVNGNDIEYKHYAWPDDRSGSEDVPDDEQNS